MKRLTGSLATLATAAIATSAVVTTALPAQAAKAPGEKDLVSVLTSDSNRFDRNRNDFDIVTEAALAVVGAKPDSPVGLLADGSVRLTAFVPTDQAFRLLAEDLTGRHIRSERRIFNTLVRTAGVDTIEQVLLYHVVPGKTLRSGKVLRSDGARLDTAQGAQVRLKVRRNHEGVVIKLRDKDRNDRNARVVLGAIDLNKGNKQIAHGVDRVLRPINL